MSLEVHVASSTPPNSCEALHVYDLSKKWANIHFCFTYCRVAKAKGAIQREKEKEAKHVLSRSGGNQ